MFINIKLGKLFKIFFVIVVIIMLIFFGISIFQIYNKTNEATNNSETIEITTNNYTNVLKTVHENIDSYLDKTIHFTGFIYRVSDFNETQFVLARNMIISSDNQAVVVGFLCNCKDSKNYTEYTWVDVTGIIKKGDYHGEIPIIEVTEIKQVTTPSDEYVYPPDDSFVPTNAII